MQIYLATSLSVQRVRARNSLGADKRISAASLGYETTLRFECVTVEAAGMT